MKSTSTITQILSEWPVMIKELKAIDCNLSKRPNKPPSHASDKHLKLIDQAKELVNSVDVKKSSELHVLEMFVEWTFNKHDPIYRVAKWYAMLAYLKAKYGMYQFPSRTSGDNRESQYYNMISLLRNTFRGKTKSICLDESLLNLPKAKEWICQENYDQRIYTRSDWQKILDFSMGKYGFYLKPKVTQKDKEEHRLYQLLQRIKRANKKGNVKRDVFNLPKAEEWIKGMTPSDKEIWQEILSFSENELGLYSKPKIKSENYQEKHYAIKIQNWRSAISKGNIDKAPDRNVFELPMAKEWLIADNPSFNHALAEWPKILKLMNKTKGKTAAPAPNSKDPFEQKLSSLIAYFKNKLIRATVEQREQIHSLPEAENLIIKNSTELLSCQKWMEMLSYLQKKYGFFKKPKSHSKDPIEKAYYNFINNHRKRIRKSGYTYESVLELPMAKEWLID